MGTRNQKSTSHVVGSNASTIFPSELEGTLSAHLALGFMSPGMKSPSFEPNPEVELDIDRESPNLFVFVKLIVIEHHHALARENSAHKVGASWCSGVDLELFVWVADSEVDDEVVSEGVAGCVVELGEFGFCHVIFEGVGLDEDPQDEDHDAKRTMMETRNHHKMRKRQQQHEHFLPRWRGCSAGGIEGS
ncbi:hypothetical protein SESBI_41399 [Sesbania bispinosa]|nr:hypothetical protein SESBI_41399 [Sesbania bispinosa]